MRIVNVGIRLIVAHPPIAIMHVAKLVSPPQLQVNREDSMRFVRQPQLNPHQVKHRVEHKAQDEQS